AASTTSAMPLPYQRTFAATPSEFDSSKRKYAKRPATHRSTADSIAIANRTARRVIDITGTPSPLIYKLAWRAVKLRKLASLRIHGLHPVGHGLTHCFTSLKQANFCPFSAMKSGGISRGQRSMTFGQRGLKAQPLGRWIMSGGWPRIGVSVS